jgi:hypothetical protein
MSATAPHTETIHTETIQNEVETATLFGTLDTFGHEPVLS